MNNKLEELIKESLDKKIRFKSLNISASSLLLKLIFNKYSLNSVKTMARIISSHIITYSFPIIYRFLLSNLHFLNYLKDRVNETRDEVIESIGLEALLGFVNATSNKSDTLLQGKMEKKWQSALLTNSVTSQIELYEDINDGVEEQLRTDCTDGDRFKIISDAEFIRIYRELSVKQRECYEACVSDRYKMILNHGAVRTGKSYATSLALLTIIENWINSGDNGAIIIIGRSLGAVHRNILEPLKKWKLNIEIPISSKSTIWKIHKDKFVHLSGYGITAIESLRGITASLIYIDEILGLDQEPFKQVLYARLSQDNSKLITTSNPLGSHHWFAKLFKSIEQGEFGDSEDKRPSVAYRYNLLTDGHKGISDSYVQDLKDMYGESSCIYKRNVLGLDVSQESTIFNIQEDEVTKIVNDEDITVKEVGIGHDKGFNSPMCYVKVIAYTNKLNDYNLKFHVSDILYYQRGHGSRVSVEQYKDDLNLFLSDVRMKEPIIYLPHDASADIKIVSDRNKVLCRPTNKKISVKDGIEYMRFLFASKRLTIDPKCTMLIHELFSYQYDEDKIEKKGDEVILKQNDHSVDALRYALVSMKAYYKAKEEIF